MLARTLLLGGALSIAGCGEIREVPVVDGSTSSSSGTTGTSDAATGSEGSTVGETPPDGDTDTDSEETGTVGSSDTTGPPPPPDTRDLYCNDAQSADVVPGDSDGGSVTILIEDDFEVADLEVRTRVLSLGPSTIHLTLSHDGGEPIDLIHNTGVDDCGASSLSAEFDDDADTPAADYCMFADSVPVLNPEQSMADLLGDGIVGSWTLTAHVPNSNSPGAVLETWCLLVTLPSD